MNQETQIYSLDLPQAGPIRPNCHSPLCSYDSCHSLCGRPFRRRHFALATTVVVASITTACSAFSSNTIHAISCLIQRSHSVPHADSAGSISLFGQQHCNGYTRHRFSQLSVLNMVSFLESPTSVRTQKVQPRTRTSNIVEFDFDNFATSSGKRRGSKSANLPNAKTMIKKKRVESDSSSRAAAANKDDNLCAEKIDSEILYEGITRAPEPIPVTVNATCSSMAMGTADRYAIAFASMNEVDEAPAQAPDATKKISTILNGKDKKKSKSSTMPGFIKNPNLDERITAKGMRMIASHRKVSRIVRSKSAKLKRCQVNSESMYKKSASVPDSLLDYAQEIHAVSRVSPNEEIELGTKTQEAMRLQKMYEDLQAKYGREPTDDEWCAAAGKINMEALRESLNDGIEAKNQLVASNLRMVQRVVNLYIRNGLGSEYNAGDLMQDGTMVSPLIGLSSSLRSLPVVKRLQMIDNILSDSLLDLNLEPTGAYSSSREV